MSTFSWRYFYRKILRGFFDNEPYRICRIGRYVRVLSGEDVTFSPMLVMDICPVSVANAGLASKLHIKAVI